MAIIDSVCFYYYLVILIFGIIGNLISLLIFTRPKLNKKTNTGLLYTILCVFNFLTFIEEALFGPFSQQLIIKIPYKYIIFNYVDLRTFIWTCLTEILPWIQVIICLDRFILVLYPMKAHVMRKKVKTL